MRDLSLRAITTLGVIVLLSTELLGPLHLLTPAAIWTIWFLTALAAIANVRRLKPNFKATSPAALTALCLLGITLIAILVGFTALVSPPNSADAMAYHLPRVVYWIQQRSVAFFPTPYYNQITLQPLAEYFMLHLWLLSGGDRLTNLVQFFGFSGSLIAVSLIARELSLPPRAQAFAALFAATLPAGILAASGAKNDYLLALWLAAMTYFALRRDWPWAALALGLALATKATAYLFAPPLLLAALLPTNPRKLLRPVLTLAAGALLLNAPQYWRNIDLSGGPLGFDSAQGDGVFRWRNDHLGWRALTSNAIRHLSDQLGARSDHWNQQVYQTALTLHRTLSLDPNDPSTTWPWTHFDPPRNANHEANANNRWHLLLLLLSLPVALILRSRRALTHAAALFTGFLVFCFYLKWQPFMSRLELPLFVLSAPLAALLLLAIPHRLAAAALCLFLLNNSRPYLLENWTRPLKGPNSILNTPRDLAYFNDMSQWNNRESYVQSAQQVIQSRCNTIGLDITRNQLEYPFIALVRAQNPAAHFQHTGVTNASARYAPPNPLPHCAILCLDCAADPDRLATYSQLSPPIPIGNFRLFLSNPAR